VLENAINQAVEQYGPVDMLVANAGMMYDGVDVS